jgi:hypothetical protein
MLWRRVAEWKYSLITLKWSASRPDSLTLGETSPVAIEQEDVWFPEPVWALYGREMSSCLCRKSNPSPMAVSPRNPSLYWSEVSPVSAKSALNLADLHRTFTSPLMGLVISQLNPVQAIKFFKTSRWSHTFRFSYCKKFCKYSRLFFGK